MSFFLNYFILFRYYVNRHLLIVCFAGNFMLAVLFCFTSYPLKTTKLFFGGIVFSQVKSIYIIYKLYYIYKTL